MTEQIKLKASSGKVHLATYEPKYKGEHYDTLCGLWVNFAYHQQAMDKVSDDTEVTCKKCLKKIEKLEQKAKEDHDQEIWLDEIESRRPDRTGGISKC